MELQPDCLPYPPVIERSEVTGVHREPPHATMASWGSVAEALRGDRRKAQWRLMLDGMWRFRWTPRPEDRPIGFQNPDYDDSCWDHIPVPSNWQMHGYGTPNYMCSGYVFRYDPPRVMGDPDPSWTTFTERNPVGSYRRWFDLPPSWHGRRVTIGFDGADSNLFVWINGALVGYSTDSRTLAEFDITPYLREGRNLVAAQVYRFCAGSYLENQDMWFLSGLYRSVWLDASPNVRIRDFFVDARLTHGYRDGLLCVDAWVRNDDRTLAPPRELNVTLYDRAGKPVVQQTIHCSALDPGCEQPLHAEIPLRTPHPWSAEDPCLYTTVLTLHRAGEAPHLVSCRSGFRNVEIKGRLFCINGTPVKLKGVNRHENWPETGHVETDAQRIRDLILLKQANCNHVRTSHYSNDPRWYELCDEFGIYLVAEANVECHGDYEQRISRSPDWTPQFVARITNSVLRDRNHPSVVIWSLGNESYTGPNLDAELAALRRLDTSRPSHYQGYPYGRHNPCDIDSQMYSHPDECLRVAQSADYTKPFYLCEYAHAMNNSMGGLGDYNDIINAHDALMGGAIWEWQDQVLWNRRDPQRPFLAMGGGFGDVPNHGAFIIKGVVFADRTPTPKYPEVRRVYQWVRCELLDPERMVLRVTNRYAFTNLRVFDVAWQIEQDGVIVRQGRMRAPVLAPGASTAIQLPVGHLPRRPGSELVLHVSFVLRRPTRWASAGHAVAMTEFVLSKEQPLPYRSTASRLLVENGRHEVVVTGRSMRIAFDKALGSLSALHVLGRQWLIPQSGLRLWVYRAPHVNDDFWASGDWRALGLSTMQPQVVNADVADIGAHLARVSFLIEWTGASELLFLQWVVYHVDADGMVVVDSALTPMLPGIPLARVGMRMALLPMADRLRWYGRGPHESYPDRMRAADLGVYQSPVCDQLTPYISSMECGNHMDTRWLTVTDRTGAGLMVAHDGAPFAFSALPYADEELERVTCRHELPSSRQTVLCIDAATMGVGSAACGPGPLDRYLLRAAPICQSFVIRPFRGGLREACTLGRQCSPARLRPVALAQNGDGWLSLTHANDADARIWYTLGDRSERRYVGPVRNDSATALHVVVRGARHPDLAASLPVQPWVDRTGWRIVACDSQQVDIEPASAILDGRLDTWWHSRWTPTVDPLPHWIVVDLARSQTLRGLLLTQRQNMVNGRIADYEIYLSDDGHHWGSPVVSGRLRNITAPQRVLFARPLSARYVRLVALSEHAGQPFTSLAEFSVIPE